MATFDDLAVSRRRARSTSWIFYGLVVVVLVGFLVGSFYMSHTQHAR